MPLVLAAGHVDATVFAAFAAGLLSFVSPCVLPLVPGYLSAITGVSGGVGHTSHERPPAQVLVPATIFCLSFTAIFVTLGMFANGVGAPLARHRATIDEVAGVLLVLMGAFFLLTPFVTALNREWRPESLLRRAGSGGPVVAGAAFAVGWTPCTGPILGAVLTASAQRSGIGGGAFLLLAYSLGLAVPFLVSAVAFDRVAGAFRLLRDHYALISVVSGAILVVVGVLVFRHEMTRLADDARSLMSSLGLDPIVRWAER
ncbi:MAG TPA: cytochrome c biogenesis protein CcdA [Solirubrobacteraceae bacterium]|jgi:cytochrome c-type biogenesis protein|nr:cytochrome c biogenesis protein CcdA [Solirubrobacteraceae bacterium]